MAQPASRCGDTEKKGKRVTFVRYGLVQLFAYAIDMGGFLLLLNAGLLGPLWANVLAKLAAGVFAFIAHRHFTFQAGDRADASRQALRYFTLLALNIPLSSALLALLLTWTSHATLAKFTADVLIVAVTYWLSKSLVFVRGKTDAVAAADASDAGGRLP